MISIVVGTNRPNSISKKIAEYYKSIFDVKNVECQIVDLIDLPTDFTRTALYENNGKNEAFNSIRDRVQASEKIVFIVPEYNGSFPGVLKSFIDGLKFPEGLKDKKAALVGVSSGIQGGVLAMAHLTDIFNYLGMNVLALKPKLSSIEKHCEDGKITNEHYIELITEQVDKLLDF